MDPGLPGFTIENRTDDELSVYFVPRSGDKVLFAEIQPQSSKDLGFEYCTGELALTTLDGAEVARRDGHGECDETAWIIEEPKEQP